MRAGERRGAAPMRTRAVDKALWGGPLTHGQREAVKLILSARGRTVGVQGNATRARPPCSGAPGLLEKKALEPSKRADRDLGL